jgi:hypothetical protein
MPLRKVILTLVPKSIFQYIYSNRTLISINKLIDLFRLNQKVQNRDDGSSLGEYEMLNQLVNKLEIDNGFVIDIAASDGYSQSSTLGFFAEQDGLG